MYFIVIISLDPYVTLYLILATKEIKMTQWYVKELSKLTQVSVRTLHHYDAIDLLKPSIRLPNGYRVYSESDLLKLQQIIALKFFGFELSQIKTLLSGDVSFIEHFSLQSKFLQEKAKTLLEASETLSSIITKCSDNKSIPWETIIKLIEVYRMTQLIENKWVAKILNPAELKDYANFEEELQSRFSANEKKESEEEWTRLIEEIQVNIDQDPASEKGIDIGRRCMNWVNNLYGKKYASLRKAIWEKGFMSGQGSQEHGLSPLATAWLDKAIYAYHTMRIKALLAQIEANPSEVILPLWEELLSDIYGNNQELKDNLIKEILDNEKISQKAKNWIKRTYQF